MKLYAASSVLALWISSIWLFLSCILYNTPVSKLFSQFLWVFLTNYHTWEGNSGNTWFEAGNLGLATGELRQFCRTDSYSVFSSVQFSCSVVSDSLRPHGLQHSRPPSPSSTPGVYSNSCPLNQWCHPTISSSVIPFFSRLQSFQASRSFQMGQLFASGGQSIGVSASASVLPMNTQDWFPLWWTGWVSLHSNGPSRVFSNTTVQKHKFFGAQLSSQSNSNIHTWLLEKP